MGILILMHIKMVKNILNDLSKIEHALRAENIDPEITNDLGIAIIKIYQCCITSQKGECSIEVDTLSDIYFMLCKYCNLDKKYYGDIFKDVIFRMEEVTECAKIEL
jgi:hypothetical protein